MARRRSKVSRKKIHKTKSGRKGKRRSLPIAFRLWAKARKDVGLQNKKGELKFYKKGSKGYKMIKKRFEELKKKHSV